MRQLTCLLLLVVLGGCSQEAMLRKLSSPEDESTARAYIDQLRARDFAALEQAIDPAIAGPDLHGNLVKMADMIPAQEPTSVKLVGVQSFHKSDEKTVNIALEYRFGEQWLMAEVAVQTKNGVKRIVGLHVVPQSKSLEAQNKFSLAGKTLIQYFVLAAAIAAALFSLFALMIAARTKFSGRKWPWILFILFGFGKVSVNWTTGELSSSLISIQLFSASALANFNGPFIVSFSLPIGAILFLAMRKRLKRGPAESVRL
jgi:hypothetical protein